MNSKILKSISTAFLLVLLFAWKLEAQIPAVNQGIVEYVSSVIGQQVDRGECWDLANQALRRNDAKWKPPYEYGKLYKPKKEQVLPGDIIQFENVKLEYTKGNTTYTEVMEHHTAVVYEVMEDGVLKIAHQNTGFSGRKVGVSELDIETVKQGKLMFYRPQAL